MDERIGCEVAVVGAGLAGASLALRLARRGVGVVLLEAHAFPREKLCGEYLSPEGGEVLRRLGLGSALEGAGYHPIRRVRVTTPRGTSLEAEVAGPDDVPGVGLSRAALDGLIVAEAERAGARFLDATRVVEPVIEGGAAVGLWARRGDGRTLRVDARLVVAADGRQSAVVSRTGERRVRSRFRPAHFGLKRHVVVEDPGASEPEGCVSLHLVPGGYVGTCRIEGGRTNVCGLLRESDLKRHRGDLDALAGADFGRNPALGAVHAASVPAGPWKTVAGVRVEVARPRVPGVLYVGDARGTVDPLGGQGMTMALLGAEQLEGGVVEVLGRGWSGTIERRYADAWTRRFRRRIMLCRAFHHALVRPGVIDGLGLAGDASRGLLTMAYRLTRDGGSERAGSSLAAAR
jgi:flavin-dependent dehydrogenase